MGEPVNIQKWPRLIRLHGHEPYKDIKIEFTGIRPGEKLCELFDPDRRHDSLSEKDLPEQVLPRERILLPRVERLLADSAEGTLSEAELKAAIFQLGR